MLSNYSFPKTLEGAYIDLDIIGEIQPNTEYALYITCDPATLTNDCWCGFVDSNMGWSSNSVYYGNNTRYFILKTKEDVNNSFFRIRGSKGVTIKHIRLIELVTNSKYSRIERFLYALYSLDSSDLPNPLSRIEELYKCLVTGDEAPTFEPLSRVEKYLMAILGAYDADSLPNPLSRVEVLLYKLATGDDNLDDVKSFLSEHEELLAEIIRNGGAGGNIDIEYILHTLSTEFNTLYNTAKKPIKSAILSGKTKLLDNLNNEVNEPNCPNTIKGYYLNTSTGETISEPSSCITEHFIECPNIPFKIRGDNRYKRVVFYDKNKTFISGKEWTASANNDQPVTTLIPENAKYIKISFSISVDGTVTYTPSAKIELLDNDENNLYLTRLESVKMPVLTTTGKNLFDIKSMIDDERVYEYDEHSITIKNSVYNISEILGLKHNIGEQYTIVYTRERISGDGDVVFAYWYTDGSVSYINPNNPTPSSTTKDLKCIELTYGMTGISKMSNICLFKGIDFGLTYEPYKSNILTVNEDVELRGIGKVKDELNLLTGELTQRIGEVVLDGSEVWDEWQEKDNSYGFALRSYNIDFKPLTIPLCNRLVSANYIDLLNGTISGSIALYTGNSTTSYSIFIRLLKTECTGLEDFKSKLQANPITVQYQLANESIKTVDLSTVNQDGNDTKLSTFNDITHVTLSSEGLIPEAELEVATKNEEVLNTMSLEMDDISKTQKDLQETLDTQSENVDSTMIATTEIYEGLL